MRLCLAFVICLFFAAATLAQSASDLKPTTHQDTLRGSITPERGWWDVLRYDISIKPLLESKRIIGSNKISYKVLNNSENRIMQIDLQEPLEIDSVFFNRKRKISFIQEGNAWHLLLPKQKKGEENSVDIYYSGTPRVSQEPPADGGFIWTTDSLGRPWISTFCQGPGASSWYPCKDHQSDEPDNGASVSIIVPDTLVAVSNGRLQSKKNNPDRTVSYKWAVKNPINNYGICLYIGKYINISDQYQGLKGKLSMDYWVLDYNREKAKRYLMPNTVRVIKCYEHWFGPYPFYEDGFKIADVPFMGEEHQSAIAYGNRYKPGNMRGLDRSGTGWGLKYDLLLVHEIAHEWFGNNITVEDQADKWVHEAFAGYAEILYLDYYFGNNAGDEYINARQKDIENEEPIIPRYGVNDDADGSDNYLKGRTIVHMIRQIMNDDVKFRKLLLDLNTRFYHKVVTSKIIEQYLIEKSGKDLSKMFDQYLRTAQIPVLEYTFKDSVLNYHFTNCINGFNMPVKVHLGKDFWLSPTTEWQVLKIEDIQAGDVLKLDPNFYVFLKKVD